MKQEINISEMQHLVNQYQYWIGQRGEFMAKVLYADRQIKTYIGLISDLESRSEYGKTQSPLDYQPKPESFTDHVRKFLGHRL